jgi:asparagine synthase (glutamine-hydrolysing)
MFGRNPREDERRFAKAAAQRAGVTLVEIDRDSLGIRWDSRLFNAPATVKPQIQALFLLPEIERINQVAAEYRTQAIWTGQGGDHLFWQDRRPFGAVDYVLLRGVRPGLLRAITDSVRLSRMSYASVVCICWNALRSHKSWAVETVANTPNRFVNTDTLPDNVVEYICPPWTSTANGLPPGKQAQVFCLADLLNRHRPFPGIERAHQHHPLISQPLIELCLRIPTYLLLHNGRSRGLARSAFKNHIPSEIYDREDKGSIAITAVDLIRSNGTFIREILQDGILMRERIIDKEVIDRLVVNREPIRMSEIRPLIACISAEVWARSWTGMAAGIRH